MTYSNITIAGRICTGKSTLSNLLKEKLRWDTFSTGKLFREYAKDHNLSIQQAQEQEMAKEIDSMVQEKLRNENNLIVDSWTAGYFGKSNPALLKVLLICDRDIRIQRFADREHVDIGTATEHIDERETAFLEKLEEIYQKDDILDPKHYNIVIDTTHASISEVADQILKKLHEG